MDDVSSVFRDPAPLLDRTLRECDAHGEVWVFGYASLIWKPEFTPEAERPARVHGWHRAFRMRSQVGRGTPQQPGIVFALLPGGCCSGLAYKIPARNARATLEKLWAREMFTGVYEPRWLRCDTGQGPLRALAFTLPRRSPHVHAPMDDAALVQILRHACGRNGSTLEYLLHTADALRRHGIRDHEIERLVRLSRRHGLCTRSD